MDPPGQELPDGLSEERSAALELASLLDSLDPEPLAIEVLLEHADALPDPLGEALREPTQRANLLEAAAEKSLLRVEGDRVSLLPQAASLLQKNLDPAERERWSRVALHLMRDAFPTESDDVRVWPTCEELLPHALAAVESASAMELHDAASVWLLERAANHLQSRGVYEEAKELAERAVAKAPGLAAHDPLQGTVRYTLGSLLDDFGEQGEARVYLERALAIHERTLDPDDPRLVLDMASLAVLFDEQEDPEAAREQAKRAVATHRDRREKHRFDASAHLILGWVLAEGKEFDAALAEHEKALAIAEETCGPNHPLVARVHLGFGLVAEDTDDLDTARAELELALEMASAALGAEHPQVAVARSNLASILQKLGRTREARSQLELALASGEATLPHDHQGLWMRRQKLASILMLLGEPKEARLHSEEALAMAERKLGADHPGTAVYRSGLAEILNVLGHTREARDQYERALQIVEGASGPNREEVGHYALNAGRAARALGDLSAAGKRFEQALRAYEGDREPAGAYAATAHAAMSRVTAERGEELAAGCSAIGQGETASLLRDQALMASRAACESLVKNGDANSLLAMASEWAGWDTDLAEAALIRAEELTAEVREVDSSIQLRIGTGWLRIGGLRRGEAKLADAARAFESAIPFLESWPQYLGATLHNLAEIRETGGDATALDLYREAAERKREAGAEGSARDLATTLLGLGRALARINQTDEALAAYEERLEILSSLPERDYQGEGITFHDLGDIRAATGALPEAIDFYREAVACKRKAGEKGNPRDLATTLLMLGRALERQEAYDEALAAYEERLEILSSLPERDYRGEGITFHDLGDMLGAQDRPEEAAEHYREAAEHKRLADAPGKELATTLLALGRALEAIGRHDEALGAYEERMKILEALPERNYQLEGVTLHDMGDAYREAQQLDQALSSYREAADRKRRAGAEDRPRDLAATLLALGRALTDGGRYEEALGAFKEQLEILEALPERDHQLEGVTFHDMGDAHRQARQLDQALQLYAEAANRKRQAGSQGTPGDLATTLLAIATTSFEAGLMTGARTAAEEAAQALRGEAESEPGRIAGALALAGRAAMEDRKSDAALALLEEADRLMGDAPEAGPLEGALVKTHLAEALDGLDRNGEADAIRKDVKARLSDLEKEGNISPDLDNLQVVFTILVSARDYERAAELLSYVRTLAEKSGKQARDSERIANMLFLLGRTYEIHEKDYDAALPAYEQRLEILASLPRRDYQGEGVTLHDIGDIHRAMKRTREAQEQYEEAAKRKRQAIEQGQSADLAPTLTKLGATYMDCGEAAAALPILEEAARLTEEAPELNSTSAERLETLLTEARKATESG